MEKPLQVVSESPKNTHYNIAALAQEAMDETRGLRNRLDRIGTIVAIVGVVLISLTFVWILVAAFGAKAITVGGAMDLQSTYVVHQFALNQTQVTYRIL